MFGQVLTQDSDGAWSSFVVIDLTEFGRYYGRSVKHRSPSKGDLVKFSVEPNTAFIQAWEIISLEDLPPGFQPISE